MLKPFLYVIYIVSLTTLISCSRPQVEVADTTAVSSTVNINQGWQFKRLDAEPNNTQWQSVNLPHTPKIEPLVVNEQWQGTAWYQKNLDVDPDWKKPFASGLDGFACVAAISPCKS